MVHNSVQAQFKRVKQDDKKEHRGHQRANTLSFSFVTDVVETCVLMVAVKGKVTPKQASVALRGPGG
jgi:hypothetical protein